MTERDTLAGKTALVTGATRGIGRAIAQLLSESGVRVWVCARTVADVERVAGEIGGAPLPADLSDAGAVEASAARFREDAGAPAPDILVHAGGLFSLAPIPETEIADFDRNWAVNTRGAFLLIRAFLPALLERASGTIVLVGSIAGRTAYPGNAAYSASKFGLRGLHEVLLEELRGTGVRATLVEPGPVDTGIWDPYDPDGSDDLPDRERMLRPREVAEAVRFVVTRPPGVRIPVLPVHPG